MKYIILFLILLGCLSQPLSEVKGGKLKYFATSMGVIPWSLHASYSSKSVFIKNVFTPMLSLDSKFNLKPKLFKEWKWVASKKAYWFKLDKSFKYPNGKSVSLKDIEFVLLKSYLTTEDMPIFAALKYLKGTEKLIKGSTYKTGMCECIEFISDDEVYIKLKSKNKNFLKDLADFYFPISPVDNFKSDYFSYKGLPLGTGAYKVVSYDDKKFMATLQLRETYKATHLHAKAPHFIKFYNGGDPLEIKPHITPKKIVFETHKGFRTVYGEKPNAVRMIDFNFENKFGKNKLFRKAVSLAINRANLVDPKGKKEPFYYLNSNQNLGLKEPKREFNPNLSRSIIAKHFSSISSKGKKLIALYYSGSRGKTSEFYQKIEKELERVGLYVSFRPNNMQNIGPNEQKNVVMKSYRKILPYNDYLYGFFNYVNLNDKGEFLNFNKSNKNYIIFYNKALKASNEKSRLAWANKLAIEHTANYIQIPLLLSYPKLYVYPGLDVKLDGTEGVLDFLKVQLLE